MNFYVSFGANDPEIPMTTLAKVEAPNFTEAERMVRERRGRDYGFIYTQGEFDKFPETPWYDPETKVVPLEQIPRAKAEPPAESRVTLPEGALP
jgi:hypothetical protein